ncbi:MAG TPA: tRNA (adenosine(37)-N6)-dimethylallyltransferase MiaA [Acidimicrobiales bacterium]|nr:tRNA (adenosine(37)-N6)-dimethylallyltransferase MiaA [Acidimicrobiales bacterium]
MTSPSIDAPERRPGPPDRRWCPVALVGPTASGKSALALAVARVVDGDAPPVELVSVDSMAVYRGMDIGTAKPTAEVRSEVPYHLVDLVDAAEEFTAPQFQAAAASALAGIAERGHRALLVGGTGLYLRSLVDDLTFPGRFPDVAEALAAELDAAGPSGSPEARQALAGLHARLVRLDPMAASRMEPTNRRRVIRALEVTVGSGRPFSTFGPGLDAYPPTSFALVGLPLADDIDQRIEARFRAQMEAGFLDEVRALAARPGGLSRTARQALGYRELLAHLEGGVPLDVAVSETIRRTRVFARRQWAWFRRDPRIVWVGGHDDAVARVCAAFGHGDPRRMGN